MPNGVHSLSVIGHLGFQKWHVWEGYGKVTYSLNVFARMGHTMWMIVAMSNTTTVACCAASTRLEVAPMH